MATLDPGDYFSCEYEFDTKTYIWINDAWSEITALRAELEKATDEHKRVDQDRGAFAREMATAIAGLRAENAENKSDLEAAIITIRSWMPPSEPKTESAYVIAHFVSCIAEARKESDALRAERGSLVAVVDAARALARFHGDDYRAFTGPLTDALDALDEFARKPTP